MPFVPLVWNQNQMTMVLLAKYAGLECAKPRRCRDRVQGCVSDARASLSQMLKHLPPPEEIADLASDQILESMIEYLPSEVLQRSFIDNTTNYATAIRIFQSVV